MGDYLPAQIGDELLARRGGDRRVADKGGLPIEDRLHRTLRSSYYLGQCGRVNRMVIFALVSLMALVMGLEHLFSHQQVSPACFPQLEGGHPANQRRSVQSRAQDAHHLVAPVIHRHCHVNADEAGALV